jgi:hypothetical protein
VHPFIHAVVHAPIHLVIRAVIRSLHSVIHSFIRSGNHAIIRPRTRACSRCAPHYDTPRLITFKPNLHDPLALRANSPTQVMRPFIRLCRAFLRSCFHSCSHSSQFALRYYTPPHCLQKPPPQDAPSPSLYPEEGHGESVQGSVASFSSDWTERSLQSADHSVASTSKAEVNDCPIPFRKIYQHLV